MPGAGPNSGGAARGAAIAPVLPNAAAAPADAAPISDLLVRAIVMADSPSSNEYLLLRASPSAGHSPSQRSPAVEHRLHFRVEGASFLSNPRKSWASAAASSACRTSANRRFSML